MVGLVELGHSPQDKERKSGTWDASPPAGKINKGPLNIMKHLLFAVI